MAGATALVAAVALAFVAPDFRATFDDFGVPLPWLSEIALTLGTWLRDWWFVALPVALAAFTGGMWFLRRRAGDLWPFSAALRPGEQARVCELLAALIDARVPLPEALRAAGWASSDPRLGLDVALTADGVAAGARASAAAARRRHLPVHLRTALRREDDPDALAEALRGAAATLRARVDARLGPTGTVSAALQPVLLLGVAAAVALLAAAMLGPLLSLLGALS